MRQEQFVERQKILEKHQKGELDEIDFKMLAAEFLSYSNQLCRDMEFTEKCAHVAGVVEFLEWLQLIGISTKNELYGRYVIPELYR